MYTDGQTPMQYFIPGFLSDHLALADMDPSHALASEEQLTSITARPEKWFI